MYKNLTYMVAQDLSQFRKESLKIVEGLKPKQIFRVLKYEFTTERQLNEKGLPYNSRPKSLMHLTIEIDKNESSVYFYDALSSRNQQPFSIFFCQGNSSGTLRCVDTAILEGFVTNVQEQYSTQDEETSLKLEVDILVRSFNFAEEIVGDNIIPFHLLKLMTD